MNLFASKNFLIIAGIIFALFFGVVIGNVEPSNTALVGNLAANVAKEAVPENKSGGGNLQNFVRGNLSEMAVGLRADRISNVVKVVRVIDGDTIEIEGGERIRYVGIDTPETVDPRKTVQCFGVEASHKNKELLEGKTVRLEKDITERDTYGRFLRYVWVGGTFVNLELVKQGFAYSYSYPPDVKYQDLFIKAQEEAREAKRGLWNSCPVQTETFITQEKNSGGACFIKGNISASGEKIYHLPGCNFYAKTKIDEVRGERWFCAESEALVAGWRKALNCQ